MSFDFFGFIIGHYWFAALVPRYFLRVISQFKLYMKKKWHHFLPLLQDTCLGIRHKINKSCHPTLATSCAIIVWEVWGSTERG